jgi:hypothetical protein
MKATILLNYSDNTRHVEEEEKARFLRGILEQCFEGTDVADQVMEIWNVDGPLPAAQKVKLRGILGTYNIQVIDNLDGHMKVYLEKELIGEWYKSTYSLKQDCSALDPKKRIYLEMHVSCWSVFDQPEEESVETE